MNILLVTDVYLPALGGTETATSNQKKILEQAGHTVYLATARTKSPPVSEKNVVYFDGPPLLRTGVYGMVPPTKRIIAQLIQLLSDQRIEIVHITTEVGLAHGATVAAKQLGIPVVFTPHTLYWRHVDNLGLAKLGAAAYFRFISRVLPYSEKLEKLQKESWAAWSVRVTVFRLMQSVDYATPPSRHLLENLQSWGIATPMTVNQNAITSTPRSAALPEIPTLLWLGRLSAEKQPLEFLEAVLVAESSIDVPFKVLIVGSGPLAKEVVAYTKKSNTITYQPAVGPAAVQELYDQSSVLCVTSNGFDNQPMVIVEALNAGRGVLYRDPKLTECFQTSSGYLAKDESVASLADAIVHIVTDEDIIPTLSKAAVKDAVRYQPQALLDRLNRVYTQLTRKDKTTRMSKSDRTSQ